MLSILKFSKSHFRRNFVSKCARDKKVPISVYYVMKPGEPVSGPRLHCRQCHYTGKVRADYAPKQCPNEKGWVDEQGIKHPKCEHRIHWYFWPEDFNPDTCKCLECLTIWHLEKRSLEQEKQVQAAQPSLIETETVTPPRRRGRPPKYKKS
jgi:hypothetical protein